MEEDEEKKGKSIANKFKVYSIEPTSRKISLKKELKIISRDKVKAFKELENKVKKENSKDLLSHQATF